MSSLIENGRKGSLRTAHVTTYCVHASDENTLAALIRLRYFRRSFLLVSNAPSSPGCGRFHLGDPRSERLARTAQPLCDAVATLSLACGPLRAAFCPCTARNCGWYLLRIKLSAIGPRRDSPGIPLHVDLSRLPVLGGHARCAMDTAAYGERIFFVASSRSSC